MKGATAVQETAASRLLLDIEARLTELGEAEQAQALDWSALSREMRDVLMQMLSLDTSLLPEAHALLAPLLDHHGLHEGEGGEARREEEPGHLATRPE